MSWKKHLRVVAPSNNTPAMPQAPDQDTGGTGTSSKYSSYLPEVYAGHPNRIQRYYQYDDMDRDSDVNAALDCIADFATQSEEQNDQPFNIKYHGEANETEVSILKEALTKWTKLNDFRARLWFIFRNTIKNGDAFFLRDPETMEWLWCDHFMIEMVKVDDEEGKTPEEYFIRGLDYVKVEKFATRVTDPSQYRTPFGTSNAHASRAQVPSTSQGANVFSLAGQNRDPRQMRMLGGQANELHAVDADHVVHLSLSVGMDINWPFSQSILEPVFKVYKQKELLEDAIIIYRVQRAPERRIFYIDTGAMPPARAKAHIEQIKNEIHQRRIPNRTGGGASVMDAAYNPLSVLEDYFIAQGCLSVTTTIPLLDGRTLTLAEIIREYEQGKVNWTYSMDLKTARMEPGKIVWAGMTAKNAQMVRVTLDNGEYVDLTPCHRMIRRDGSEVRAGDLRPGDSLMPLYLFPARSGPKQKIDKYARYLCNETGKKRFVHSVVCPKPLGREWVVHHKDFDSTNNNPENLEVMRADAHTELHRRAGTFSLGRQWGDPVAREKLVEGIRRREKCPEFKQRMRSIRASNGAKTWSKVESAAGSRAAHVANIRKANKRRALCYSPDMFSRLLHLYNSGFNSLSRLLPRLQSDDEFQRIYAEANKDVARDPNKPWNGRVNDGHVRAMAQSAGYRDWADFKESYSKNHRVVSVEVLPYREDVADITVEGPSDSHVFAIGAGIYVHNSEGRGSKVETLSGGELVGEIGDLLFFSKKLARGLRIPPSYLSLGEEESNVTFNDGKLGQAMIQEFRFNKYCMRLQALLAPTFDREFKRFLRESGVAVEASLFDLQFNEPQNFTKYRQIELDSAQVSVYSQVADNRRLSERWKMKRFLNMTDEDLIENERMWAEENPSKMKKGTGSTPAEAEVSGDLSSVGVRPPPPMDDLGGLGDLPPEGEDPMAGAAPGGAPMPGGGSPPAAGGAAAPIPPPGG